MWFDERQSSYSKLGQWLKPVFAWFVGCSVRPTSEDWRYTSVKWAMAPLIEIPKPKWFTRLIVTLCTEPKADEQSKS